MGFPPAVAFQLEGWFLFFAHLEVTGKANENLARLRQDVAERCRASHRLQDLPQHPTVAAIRRLFRQAGCDPTRWRPSSEALVRRVLRGEPLPSILPLVDINNCLSLELLVPACVMAQGKVGDALVLRAGVAGESMLSLRGRVELEGKPLLADHIGPASTPITDALRVKVEANTNQAWLVTYLPKGTVEASCVARALAFLLQEAPVARILATASVAPQ